VRCALSSGDRCELTARGAWLAIRDVEHLLNRSGSGRSPAGGLGRAIVREPKAFLMDEPLGALDTEFRHVMTGELRALHDRPKATTIYVTHDKLEAMSMADLIAVMNRGVVEQVGAPREIYDRPASMFVADFIASPPMNLLGFRGRLEKVQRVASLRRLCSRSARRIVERRWRSARRRRTGGRGAGVAPNDRFRGPPAL